MARPEAKNVDYFPCYCVDGKVLFILESRWGNDGYAFFYKLWKRLGNADFHYIDLRPLDNWEYFRAKMGVSDAETTDILNKLAEMGVIDPGLWAEKIIWSDSFLESVKDVWMKRKQLIPQKPLFLIQKPALPLQNETETPVSDNHNPQSKVNKRKENKKEKAPDDFVSFYSAYPNKKAPKEALKVWLKLNGTRPPIETLLLAIRKQIEWRNNAKGEFRPEWKHPATWLNHGCWADEVPEDKKESW